MFMFVFLLYTILTGGYRLSGAVNGAQMSLLLDTGPAVTLLREDTWARAAAKHPQELQPRMTLKLHGQRRWDATDNLWLCVCRVGAGGGEEIHDRSRSGEPVNLEGHPWSRFLKRHRARIDLENKQLHLTDCTLPLRELEPVTAVKRKDRAERTAEVPPFSVMEVIAYL